MNRPETRYARSGDVHIAYQILGEGPLDLVFVPGFVSNLDHHWEDPGFTHLLHRLASFCRLIQFDKRGTGLSDRVPITDLPSLEARMDDVRAVLDAVGSKRAALFGASEGGPLSMLFAATYPERTRALVLYGSYAHFHSWVMPAERMEEFIARAETAWGRGDMLVNFAPGMRQNERFRDWWARFERLGASPAAAIALARMNAGIDVRRVLPTIRVPTLVLHRTGDVRVNVAAGRYLAQFIDGARYVELPGSDHLVWVGDVDRIVDEIEEFLTGGHGAAAAEPERVLATVLIVEMMAAEGEAEDRAWLGRLERYRAEAMAVVERHRGWVIEGLRSDGSLLATFDGPGRAIRAAVAIAEGARQHGLAVRAGLHTGEVQRIGGIGPMARIAGVALQTAQRIAAVARSGEVLVSGTVHDLVAGSGLRFRPRLDGPPIKSPGGADLPLFVPEGAAAAVPAAAPTAAGRDEPGFAGLSLRERQVLGLVARGLSNAAIATELTLSEHTVKRHVGNILTKLDLPTRAAAAALAARAGIT
ncbi:MAG TPA: alpha/beta fold hydrolase [Stellaceae bacterium]|nr:alpha/beta fold hydrolase [Stellaceae bacterium]